MDISEYTLLFRGNSLQRQYFEILQDCLPHCRRCAQRIIGSEQLAGGGGIQGLERGNRIRPGLVIETTNRYCNICGKITKWDQWTGEFRIPNAAANLPLTLRNRVYRHYDYTDSIDQRQLPPHALVIDHRFPMLRWGRPESKNPLDMSEGDIQRKFQLLKKDNFGNYNLLKSRACEHCKRTGYRGCPFGIKFFYEGDERWPDDCPTSGPESERGCIGCGWYDLNTWRLALNEHLKNK